jgi:phasin family protein
MRHSDHLANPTAGEIMINETTPTNLFGDIVKLLEQYKLPGIDIAAIIEMRRKDIEALMTANRVALEGAQSVGQKQVEILRSTLDQLSSLIQQATASGSMTEKTTKTGEVVQQVLQRALENMRELAETAYKSQSDTYAVLTKRIQENLDEARALLGPEK